MLQPIYFEISIPPNFSESLEDDPKQNGTVNCLPGGYQGYPRSPNTYHRFAV